MDELLFPDAAAAVAFAVDWLADEDPGCYFEVKLAGLWGSPGALRIPRHVKSIQLSPLT